MAPVGWDTEPESGLLDNYEFTVTSAKFATDLAYNNGNTLLLMLDGKTNDPDFPDNHIWIPLGKGWQSLDGGKSIVHESRDDSRYFVKTSIIYAWIQRMVHDFGMGELLTSRGSPLEAKIWPGLKLHIKREVLTYEGLDSSGPKAMPQAFLGVVGEGGATSGAVAPAPAAAPTESAEAKIARVRAEQEAKKAAGSNGSGGSLRDQVIATIKGEPDNAAAQNLALSIDGVTADDTLIGEVLDTDSELWKVARS